MYGLGTYRISFNKKRVHLKLTRIIDTAIMDYRKIRILRLSSLLLRLLSCPAAIIWYHIFFCCKIGIGGPKSISVYIHGLMHEFTVHEELIGYHYFRNQKICMIMEYIILVSCNLNRQAILLSTVHSQHCISKLTCRVLMTNCIVWS